MSATEENEMIIDLSKVNRSARYGRSETFQNDAFKIMMEKLDELVMSGTNSAVDSDDISMQRRHDTLFIDGERGTGKTAFLINTEWWLKENKEELWKKIEFFGPVDPTLLFDDENFLGVVLGTIVGQVNDKLKSFNIDESKKEEYFKALEKVSESLKSAFELKKGEISGIDAIASHASSKTLEQHTHAFFSSVAKLLEKEVLILLIDDVDMAFDKGFDVLETIRKFLASPYIIPIVSGDANLYKYLIKKEFTFSANYRKEYGNKPISMDKGELRKLVDQYFNKVMPNDQRIELKPVRVLRKRHPMLLKASDKGEIYYNQFKDFEIQVINYGINQVQFTSRVFPENLRSFVQYLAKKQEIIEKIPNNIINYDDKDHTPYKPGKEKELVDWLYSKFDLFKRSLEATASFYRYSTVLEEKRLSLMLENDLNAIKNGHISIYSIFKGAFLQDKRFREELGEEYISSEEKSRKVFCEIQKEKLNTTIFFAKTGDNGLERFFRETDSPMAKVLTRLFFYDSYYNESSATRAYVVTGKFIEALFYTLDFEANEKATYELESIVNGRPYNIGLDGNYVDDEADENSEQEDMSNVTIKENIYQDSYIDDSLLEKLREARVSQGQLNFTTNQLHNILHKYFKNLNALKDSKNFKDIIKNDTSFSFMGRVCAILINAVAFFEKTGNVEESNIAMGKEKFTFKSLKSTSNAFRRNIQPLLPTENSSDLVEKSMTYMLYSHPFIEFLMDESNEEKFTFEFGEEKQRDLGVLREAARRASGITTKNIFREGVVQYLRQIEQTHNDKLIELVVSNFDKRRTLESKIHEAKIPEAEEFYKKYKSK